jgi:4'-phosphopantetheinyl transferase
MSTSKPSQIYWLKLDKTTTERRLQELAGSLNNVASESLTKASRREQFIVSRALIRYALSDFSEGKLSNFDSHLNTYGKPYLKHSPIGFNISHSQELIVCAVGLGGDIGVDVEYLGRVRQWHDIAQSYFTSAEQQVLAGLSKGRFSHLCYKLWTLKEVYFKARGTGIIQSLDSICFAENILKDEFQQDDFYYFQKKIGEDFCLSFAGSSTIKEQALITSPVAVDAL